VVNVESAEAAALRAAAARDGVLTWAELQALGVSEGLVRQRLRTGAWQRPHVGVYVLTPAISAPLRTTARAALSAAAAGAVASHLLAGHLHRVHALPEVTVPTVTVPWQWGRRTTASLIVHRAKRVDLAPSLVQGYPATSLTRTLADLSPELSLRDLVAAMDSALTFELVTLQLLPDMTRCWAGHPGADRMRSAVALARAGSDSVLETYVRLVIIDGGLPEPVLQIEVTAGGRSYRIDLGYPQLRLGI
jgi:hypothetical protein